MSQPKISDMSEAFDWAMALWYWLSHNYEGQWCPKYAAMCAIPISNIPSIDFEENDREEYAQTVMIYNDLTEENWEAASFELQRFLEKREDDL